MKLADLYIRVSTDEQADKGYSQRSQEEILRKYCEINQITIRKVVLEDHSAKTFNRPKWTTLLLDLRKRKGQVDLILFTKWDRFSRNAGDAYQMISTLRKLSIEPQAIEQPLDLSIPENKMMLAFYLAAPEVENDRRALNVLFGMRRARKEGRWMGPAPFGYSNKITESGKKYITPKEPEASTIKWAFNRILESRESINSIRKEAKERGLKGGKNFLSFILRNPVYCGKIYVSKLKDEESRYVEGQHEGIVSESLFFKVQEKLDGRVRTFKLNKNSSDHFLRGHLTCPLCGRQLTGSVSKGRSGRYSYYHCISKCKTRFRTDNANELFIRELKKYVPRPGMSALYIEVLNQLYKQDTKVLKDELKLIKEDLERENARLSTARNLLLNKEIEASDYRTLKSECERKILALEGKLFSADRPQNNIDGLLNKAIDTISQLDQLFKEGDLKKKREIVGSIFPENLIFDGFNL